jgi:hypothetical protein
MCALVLGGCADLFRDDEKIPDEIVRQFIDQERLADLFYIEPFNLEPEQTGDPERRWIIDLYHQRRSVSPELCLGTQLRLHVERQQAEYLIVSKERMPLVALQTCDGTDEGDFIWAHDARADENIDLSDQEIRRAVDDVLGFARTGKTADPGTAVSFSSTVLRDNLHLVDPSRLFSFHHQNGNRTGLSFVIPGTYSLFVFDLVYRGDELAEIDVHAEGLDIRGRGPASDFERSLYRK